MNKYHLFPVVVVFCVAVLTGCATGLPVDQQAAESAVSQQAALSSNERRAKVHTELGSLYLQKGNLAVALEEARAALAAYSAYAPAHSLMGLAYMQLRENAAAEKSFELALGIAPGDPEINNNFGWFLCQTGRERQSLAHFNVAIKSALYATPAMPNINAGICLLRLKDEKVAEEYFSRALRLDPANLRAVYFLAETAFRQGRFAATLQYLEDLHKRVEPSAESLWLAVRAEHKLGHDDRKVALSTQLLRKFPGTPEASKLAEGLYE
jgi:type IV pilus assembly protein PilF